MSNKARHDRAVVDSDASPLSSAEWDEFALLYRVVMMQVPGYRDLIDAVVAYLRVTESDVVVDLGCGVGNFVQGVLESCPGVQLHGVDASTQMLRCAEESLQGRGDVSFYQFDLNGGDWVKKLACKGVTAAVSVNALYTLDDPLVFFDRLRGIVKTGGRVVVSNPHTKSYAPVLERLKRELLVLPVELPKLLQFNDRIVKAANRHRYWFLSADELVAMMNSCGFQAEFIVDDAYDGVNALVGARAV